MGRRVNILPELMSVLELRRDEEGAPCEKENEVAENLAVVWKRHPLDLLAKQRIS